MICTNRNMLTKIIVWFFLLSNFEQILCKKQKMFQILRFQSCPEHPNLAMMMTQSSKKTYGNNTSNVTMSFVVTKKLETNLEGKFNLWKCDLSGTPDSCEHYIKDFKMKQICRKMLMKNQVWSTFVEGFKPTLRCPIEPDKYEVVFLLTDDIFKYFPVPRGVWKNKTFIYVGNEMVTCFEAKIRIIERQQVQ